MRRAVTIRGSSNNSGEPTHYSDDYGKLLPAVVFGIRAVMRWEAEATASARGQGRHRPFHFGGSRGSAVKEGRAVASTTRIPNRLGGGAVEVQGDRRVVFGVAGKRDRFAPILDGVRIFEKRLIDFNLALEIAEQLVGRTTNFTYSDGKIIFFRAHPGTWSIASVEDWSPSTRRQRTGAAFCSGSQVRAICSATQISWANNVRARFGKLTRATIARSP